jgi:hypothetical protein
MHPSVNGASLAEPVKQAVEALLKDPVVPLGEEKDGSLRFFSEKLNDCGPGACAVSTAQGRFSAHLQQHSP